MQIFDNLSYINIGTEAGDFLGIGREDDGDLYLELLQANDNRLTRYELDPQGNPTQAIEGAEYPFQADFWYANAVAAGRPVWSSIYQWVDRPDVISISCSYPILDSNHRLVGVIGIDFLLSQISIFLQELKISESGKIFIIERNGQIVASSSSERSYVEVNGQAQRLNALQSQDHLIQATARHLEKQFGGMERIHHRQQFTFKDENGDRLLTWVEPWQDELGLDWLVVATVPESDFMGQINDNTRNTVLLCLFALTGSILLGIYNSRWVVRPVLKLNHAANQIAVGQLDQHIDLDEPIQIIEISNLANTFNSMSSQLKSAFDSLEAQKNAFARFFPPEYLLFLNKQGITDIELGDHISKEMAIMFSDIRSFTTLSEKMSPKENFDFVNAYLQSVSPEIHSHNGFVVKFLGDGMMAIFPDSVDDAVAAGIAKFKQVQMFNQSRQSNGLSPIAIGMGIHVGYMMVGMVGEHNRIQGDAFSDHVNLTARLEGLTKYYGVSLLISEDGWTRLSHPEQYKIRFLDRAIVKGRNEPIGVYEILDAEVEAVQTLKLLTQPKFEQGIQHYQAGDLAGAKAYFEQVLQVNAADKTAKLYLERIELLAERGIPAHWDGIWAFSEK
ncbi:adenylate/guanylate cyclase domain-containing protein [Egbenema bharatensis]|uniref:adenylate/guanylate cyclase domain-containing protein n=1 Tax=Egbenema bharatensis TaxID=3463334 RepID=UPI003A86AB1D